jgi:hypothetical protein
VSFRSSQNPSYWTTQFQLTPDDVEFLQEFLQARERPVVETDLVHGLVEARFRREDQRIRKELARGKVYQPKDAYDIGQEIVFPALDFTVGAVTAKRAGRNPEHGDFEVITVKFDSGGGRYYASSLKTPHKMNRVEGADGLSQEDIITADEIVERHGREIRTRLHQALLDVPGRPFVNQGRYWALRSMLADVHIGILNIAEAAIDVRGSPLATIDILPQLDLPQEVPPALAAFSVDLAMSQDDRFVDVGVDGRDWYLERLMPEETISIPRRLQHVAEPYDRSVLNVPLLQLEWELDDEWSEGGATSVSIAKMPRVDVALLYPHRRSGTLPLTERTSSFFQAREGKRSMFTFVDGRWGKRFPGWVIPEGRYVCGLSQWYEEHGLPVGGWVVIERTDNPMEVVVDLKPHRLKREWVRMARVEGHQLRFQLQKQAVSVDYDDAMVVAEADAQAIDDLRRRLYREAPSVATLVNDIAPQLMGLSTQGTVHVKTIYSAVNMLRRTAPGPIFAAMVANPRFQAVGSSEFAMARS